MMKRKLFIGVAAIALAALLVAPAGAQLVPYSEDFETLDAVSEAALGWDGAGWSVFGIAYDGVTGGFLYTYGPFSAPNGTPGFSSVAVGEGGAEQGDQQVVIYNDYNNTGHFAGAALIEAIVYREWTIGPDDVGSTWEFSFDAKRGDINDPTSDACIYVGPCTATAKAFIKTIDPANSYALTNFVTQDTTSIPDTWGRYSVSLEIDASLVGQLFQIGFDTVATNYHPSGVFYDNINLEETFCNTDPTVTINGCDSGVPNQDLDECTMNDAISACATSAAHHGQFVSCVANLVNEWAADGLISGRNKGAIISCAATNRTQLFMGLHGITPDVVTDENGASIQMWNGTGARSDDSDRSSKRGPRGRDR